MSQRLSPALLRSLLVLAAIAVLLFLFRDKLLGASKDDAPKKSELGAEKGPTRASQSPLPPPRKRADAAPPTQPKRHVDKKRYEELKTRLDAARDRREAQAKERREQDESERPELAAATLDKEYIQAQMKEIVPLFRECYEMALDRDPSTGGKIVVEMTLTGEEEIGGILESSEVLEDQSDVTAPEFVECVRESMYAIELDAPEGGGTVTIRYPLKFANTNEPPSESETPQP